MLIQVRFSIFYWAEVIKTVNYVLNRLLFSVLGGKIFYILWTGSLLTLKYLKIFGLSVYVYISDYRRKKFDSRAEKMVLVGYMDVMKVYKFFYFVIY